MNYFVSVKPVWDSGKKKDFAIITCLLEKRADDIKKINKNDGI